MGISKSKQKSSSSNQAFPFLRDTLGGTVGAANTGAQGIAALLSGDSSGFDSFKGATGFNRILSEGLSGITNAGAAKGLLRSGASGKALMSYGQGLQNQTAQQYIQNLLGLGQMGLSAAGAIGSTGGVSNQTSKSKSLQAPTPSWGA